MRDRMTFLNKGGTLELVWNGIVLRDGQGKAITLLFYSNSYAIEIEKNYILLPRTDTSILHLKFLLNLAHKDWLETKTLVTLVSLTSNNASTVTKLLRNWRMGKYREFFKTLYKSYCQRRGWHQIALSEQLPKIDLKKAFGEKITEEEIKKFERLQVKFFFKRVARGRRNET